MLRAGLGIKRLELARAAGHPEQNARPLLLSQIVGMKRHPIGETDGNSGRDRHARRPQADRLEEMPAPDHASTTHRHVHRLFFQGHVRSPSWLAPGQELGRVDQAPVDVFKRFRRIADRHHVLAANFNFLSGGLARQHPHVQRAFKAVRGFGATLMISASTVPGRA